MTYDRTEFRDPLFPEGRPECGNRDGRPVYLKGLCYGCWAAATPICKRRLRLRPRRKETHRG